MPTIARYMEEGDARRRAAEEGLGYELLPSESWPDYPWAVMRAADGINGELDKWAERLLEEADAIAGGPCGDAEPATSA